MRLFIILLILSFLISISFSQSWLSGWQYRIPISIIERSGKNLQDYQVLITLNTQSLISQGKMRSDCGDIRFTDSDGTTLLNYWIESGCNSVNTRIWVKVPNIPASSTKTIYLYYGNPSANSLSNGDLVFEFFDDFRYATSININKWQVSRYSNDANNECKLENGVLWLTKKSMWKGCNIKANNFNIKYNSQYVIHVKWKVDYVCGNSNDGDGMAIVIDGKNTAPFHSCYKGFSTYKQGIVVEIFDDEPTTSSYNGFGIDDETINCRREGITSYWGSGWDKRYDLNDGYFEIKLTGNQIIVNYQDLNPFNGLKSASIQTNVWNPNGNGYFMIGAAAGCSSCGSSSCNQPDSAQGIEYVFIRKFASPEPTISLGSEEIVTQNLNPVWITYFSNTTQTLINSPIEFSSLWNASTTSSNVFLSHYIFSYSLNNAPWINETYEFSFSQSWLSGWQYRIPITIKENSGSSLTDYQVLITLDTQSLIAVNKMRSDCGDIRFTDSDGITLLNYWIESGCNSVNTRIWVKVPNIPASSTKTIYLYYGNPGATSLSDYTKVFIQTERENNPSISRSIWGSGGNNPEDTFNTYFHDARNEILYTPTDFEGLVPVIITQLKITVYQQPGRELDNYRVRYQLREASQAGNPPGSATFTSTGWILVFGPVNLGRPAAGSNVTLNLNPYIYWTQGNLLLDLSRDTTSYVSGGGMYRKLINRANTMCTFYSDSGRTWPFDGSCTLRNYVPAIIFVGWFRKYISPEPTINLGSEETFKPFSAWANVTKSFSQPGTLCWRFYVNNSLNLWNATPISPTSCIQIISPEFSLEVKLLHPNEGSIQNLAVGDYLSVKAQVKMKSQYDFCINLKATLRYNSTSNFPDSTVPTTNSIISANNPQNFQICTNEVKVVEFEVFTNKPTFKILDVLFEAMNVENDTKDFYINVSLIANKEFKLEAGWNLISIPYKNFILDLTKDECNLKEKVFHYFNSQTKKWEYYTYKTITYGKAYWVYVEKDCSSYFAASGIVNPSDLPKASKGINYIGSTTQQHDFNSIADNINCNNPIARYYDTKNKKFVQTTIIVPWKGYIIECS